MVCKVKKMTDMKSAYDEISPSARNQALIADISKFKILGDMKHDIRSPMHAVKGLTSILAASGPLTSRQEEVLNKLEASTEDLFTLIDNMLDFLQVTIGEQDKRSVFSINFSRLNPLQGNHKIYKKPSV